MKLLVGVARISEIVRTNSSTRVHVMAHRSVSSGAVTQSTGDQAQLSRELVQGADFFDRPPFWYQPASFQYNARCVLGLLPGAIMLGVVAGRTFVGVLVLCVLAVLIAHSLGYDNVSLVLTLCSGFVCQMTNAYCMVPLIYHSVLNLPLLAMLHAFIALSVGWCILQHTEGLKKQDGRLPVIVEKLVFAFLPALVVVMVTWVSGMVLGREALPLAAAVSGLACVTLYLVPLESSYAKPGTPFGHGVIQHWVIVVVYQLMVVLTPAVLYAALHNITDSLQHLMQFLLAMFSPVFILTLLEAQQVFYWLGLTSTPVRVVRWISGAIVLGSLSTLALLTHSSSPLPALLVPILFVSLALVTSLDTDTHQTTPTTWLLAVVAELLCLAAGLTLPWGVSYYFSVLSLPLSLLQLALLLLAMASIILLIGWRRDLSLIWPTYHAVCVGCEMILTRDGFYPLSLLLCTGTVAVLLCIRLHSIGRVPLPHTILCLCIHVLKLAYLLPTPSLSSPFSVMSNAGLFLSGIAVLRTNTLPPPIKLKPLLLYTGVFGAGVCLSTPFIISHTISLVSQAPSSPANLAMLVCASTGVFMLQYLPSVAPSKGKAAVSYLPIALLCIAGLFYLLQPEFVPIEIVKALGVLLLHHLTDFGTDWRIEVTLQIMAWGIILTWAVVLSAIFFAVMVAFRSLMPSVFLHMTAAIGGAFTGLLAALRLMHKHPLNLPSMLYGVAGGTAAAIVSVALINGGHYHYSKLRVLVSTLFLVLAGVSGCSVLAEWNIIPEDLNTAVPLPSTLVYTIAYVCVAMALKTVSLKLSNPFLPVIANTSCLLAFLFSLSLPLGLDEAVVISLMSCVMLLAQPDGIIIPRSAGLFLAPSLALSSLTLYTISSWTVLSQLLQTTSATQLELAVRVTELVLLVAAIPGQVVFIRCLWTGRSFTLSVPLVLLYLLPNGLLPRFGQGSYNAVLGSSAILSFCLLSLTDYSSIRRL